MITILPHRPCASVTQWAHPLRRGMAARPHGPQSKSAFPTYKLAGVNTCFRNHRKGFDYPRAYARFDFALPKAAVMFVALI